MSLHMSLHKSLCCLMSVPCVCAGLADTDRILFVQTDWQEAIWEGKEGFDDALTQAKGQPSYLPHTPAPIPACHPQGHGFTV